MSSSSAKPHRKIKKGFSISVPDVSSGTRALKGVAGKVESDAASVATAHP